MKILGLDTSSKFLGLGLCNGALVYGYNLDLGTRHSALLMPTLERVLAALKWEMEEIDYFACGLGPGSFTGIRVGLATVKGLSWALGKPSLGIPTLDILARGVKGADSDIVVAVDAKRNLIYCSIYKIKGNILKRTTPYLLLSERDFLKKIKPGSLIVGDAAGLYKDTILKNSKGARILQQDYWYPKGQSIMELALERIKAGKINNAFDLKPLYLYPKECQIRKR